MEISERCIDQRKGSRGSDPEKDQASYTYENAIFSRQVADAAGSNTGAAGIIARATMQVLQDVLSASVSDTEFLVVPSNAEVAKENWCTPGAGIKSIVWWESDSGMEDEVSSDSA